MDDDEKMARMLQEQFDLEIAQQAASQKEKAQNAQNNGNNNSNSNNNNSSSTTTTNNISKNQEDLDLELAYALQQEMYSKNNHNYNGNNTFPPPPPSSSSSSTNWDTYHNNHPKFLRHERDDTSIPSPECIKRITSDLKDFLKSGFKTMFVEADEDDITHVQALLVGPEDTPYAFGFFHFDLLFPSNYPWKSPKVQLITTDNGQCRFSKFFLI